MRQKNGAGAEVEWNDPEEGRLQRPPSGAPRSSLTSKAPSAGGEFGMWHNSTCVPTALTHALICFDSYSWLKSRREPKQHFLALESL